VSLYLGHNFLTHITKFIQFAETILTGFVFSKIFIYGVNNGKQKNKRNEHHKPTVQIKSMYQTTDSLTQWRWHNLQITKMRN